MTYREPPSGTRWVCIVCYAHASSVSGLCPTCHVDLLSVDDPEVRGELSAEAERRMQKKMYGEYFGLSILGFVVSMPIVMFSDLLFVGTALGVGWAFTRIYEKVRPRSALGLYAERRRRLALELSGKPLALPARDDPEDMGTAETLRWLGLDDQRK